MCGDSADEASTRRHPETDEACTSRHPEDERDQKLKELTATVERLASVVEHMSKSQKSEPVELRPKQRSRSPRRRRRSSRSDSRTGDRGHVLDVDHGLEEDLHCRGKARCQREAHRQRGVQCRGAPRRLYPSILQGTAVCLLARALLPSLRDR